RSIASPRLWTSSHAFVTKRSRTRAASGDTLTAGGGWSRRSPPNERAGCVLWSGLSEEDRLGAFPEHLPAELAERLAAVHDRGEVVAREHASLAGEGGRAIREQNLRLADAARVEEDLAGRGIAGRILGPKADVQVAERDPARLAAPARVDDPRVQRQQPPERGYGRGRGFLLQLCREAVVPRDD